MIETKQMNDKVCFLDTNILIYAYSQDEIVKRRQVDTILVSCDKLYISTQVINEFVNVMRKKKDIPYSNLTLAIKEFSEIFTISTVSLHTINQALMIAEKYHYSYFDSLMVSSALENQCSLLYTEDLHHNQLIEKSLIIKNPFIS